MRWSGAGCAAAGADAMFASRAGGAVKLRTIPTSPCATDPCQSISTTCAASPTDAPALPLYRPGPLDRRPGRRLRCHCAAHFAGHPAQFGHRAHRAKRHADRARHRRRYLPRPVSAQGAGALARAGAGRPGPLRRGSARGQRRAGRLDHPVRQPRPAVAQYAPRVRHRPAQAPRSGTGRRHAGIKPGPGHRHQMGRGAEEPFRDIFVQGKQSLQRAHGGLGIGLSLVRRLVELHGGFVRIDSEGSGKGSTATVTLPRLAGCGQRAGAAPAPRDAGGRQRRRARDDVDAAATAFLRGGQRRQRA
ncbi:ATP-binding protein [Massilia genomosp. 1]|uniref:ATP-binding protein n=1 Tax=Massilia genomosp. 1 TaxID=2609280 RepID=UPI001423B203